MPKNFNQIIESTIEDYAKAISSKFNIKYSDLMNIWNGKNDEPVKIVSSSTLSKSDIDFESDSEEEETKTTSKESKSKPTREVKKDETSLESLKKKAKELGIPGISKFKASNKDELLELINNAEKGNPATKGKAQKSPPKKPVVKEEPKVSTEYIQKKITSFSVSKNKFGNYWNESSGLVFDKETRQAVGKQQENGDVIGLTKQDIEFCKNNNISFKLPSNIISEEKESKSNSDDEESIDDDEDELDEDELEDEDD